MSESVSEKVVRLETQMTDNKIQLNRVESKVDALITKIDDMAVVKLELTSLREDIIELKRRRFVEKWLFPTLSAIAAIIVGYLFASAFHLRIGG